jgi:putative ABC transport system permease protein
MRELIEWTRRLMGSMRASRSDSDLEEELRVHLALAAEEEQRRGLTPPETARAAGVRTGGVSQAMERLRDQRGVPTLDALTADIVFGWRQVVRHRSASLSTILSLGLAMGATLAALRLVDAVLLRPLPVADPSRLFAVTIASQDVDGGSEERDDFDYPTFRKYVAATEGRADVMLVGIAVRRSIRMADGESEAAVQQFVSGNVFSIFGLQPALGRLLGATDDVSPDAHPVAVISHDFWRRRFGSDRAVIGRTFHVGTRPIEIVGVAPEGFTGTEPGAVTDFFLPAMMNAEALDKIGWSWFRIWVRPRSGVDVEQVRAVLEARFHADQVARVKGFAPDTPKSRIDAFLAQQLMLQPARSGVSAIQKSFRRPLWVLTTLAALLLLIACANAANLLLARAMSRRTEMALRISIGAARGRLIQLMLIESALLAFSACAAGALFAAAAAPFIVSMLAPADRPVRLILDPDWRTFSLGASMTLAVTILFGLAPALRASAIRPIGMLTATQHRQRNLTDALVAVQMAFCVFLLFGASLFLGTFNALRDKPLGFESRQLVHATAESRTRLTPAAWEQLAARLRELPGVEAAAVAGWAPLTGNRWRWAITIDGKPSDPSPNWVSVSPGYFHAMRMRLIEGREFRSGDLPPDATRQPSAGVAIVNQSFARAYFGGRSPVGRRVIVNSGAVPLEIVGMTADAVYLNVREAMQPAIFVPLESRNGATLMIRTMAAGADVLTVLRREITRIRPDVVVREVVPFEAFVTQQMIRERLLAALSTFFAGLALVLAIIGIYGVLNYAVTRERRDIGLRMALGARPTHVLTLISRRLLAVGCAGAVVGIGAGLAFSQTVRTLLFEMEPTDPLALIAPLLALAAAAVVAAIPPALRAVRIDPAQTLKTEG